MYASNDVSLCLFTSHMLSAIEEHCQLSEVIISQEWLKLESSNFVHVGHIKCYQHDAYYPKRIMIMVT